ncbi:histidine kinase [Paenibacillus alkaliterrae]|uniref:histidine kinase n=1 Tax=Paenibacillus alkaliterrae TaxID=320909 RepID=UPI001F1C2E9D|nr:histidine kinase [Paenibacillus alkaliterrae]MCF2938168.1 histidine kinase [Paenibacillus alkaliterrae]
MALTVRKIVKTIIEQSFLKLQLSEIKYKLQAAQMTDLQSLINPHFLFNAIETLSLWGSLWYSD